MFHSALIRPSTTPLPGKRCHGIRSGDGKGVQTRLRENEPFRAGGVLSPCGAGQRSFLKAFLIQPCTLVGKIVAGGCYRTPIEIYRVNATPNAWVP